MKHTRSVVLCIGALAAITACSGDSKRGDVLSQDAALARDLELANIDTLAKPQLQDVATNTPPAPAPIAPRPAPRPTPKPTPKPQPAPRPTPAPKLTPAPAPAVTASGNTVETAKPSSSGNSEGRVIGVVSAGTSLNLAAGQQICTNTNTPGDRFTATLTQAVTASNGVVIPVGANAVLEVTSVKRSESAGDNMIIGLVARSITYNGKTYPVSGEVIQAETNKVRASDNNDAGKVIGGAVAGAILGRILGGKNKTKGTVLGGAGGAAAGAILAEKTANYNACIPAGGRITFRLNQPISVQGVPTSTPAQTYDDGI